MLPWSATVRYGTVSQAWHQMPVSAMSCSEGSASMQVTTSDLILAVVPCKGTVAHASISMLHDS
jgi:hypothetical protein